MSLLDSMPDEWKVDIVVKRGGGRDRHGNPTPVVPFPRQRVLIAPRNTNDPTDMSEVTDDTAVLYDESMLDGFRYQAGDRIEIADEFFMAGKWLVDGRPGEWFMGTEVKLVKG